ncbi:hypothetical protein C8J56DRAFT_352912 [Mycena floridula]|nr:hypothetical protein C8J56DRAFT_352912 [Mycena floridula]
MGPIRTSEAGPSTKRQKRTNTERESNAPPGVQKLKASLRQTRRLLAKDTIAADVRVETERRLKALESELAQAELNRKERAFATRYHKVKFFERQKVVRKISQTKRALSTATGSEQKTLEIALFELRVDLNYILHYPKLKKYISLFPPGEESQPPDSKTDAERQEVRQGIMEQMKAGHLSSEPELHIEDRPRNSQPKPKDTISKAGKKARPKEDKTQDDTFFGDDDEEEDS